MPRSRLGPLAIESKLGDSPSQSCVWRAIHVRLKKAVAVKVFSSPFGATPEARTDFASEWETLKKLAHPSIVKCYGGGFESNDAYLAYELIEGETLAAQLERRNRLPWESVLELAEPLIDGLQYLHEQELIHGAIQPDKIMIAGLSPVLVDIRVDRYGSRFNSSRPPTTNELSFRPPEWIQDPHSLSIRSDLYSFGATLYFALTGRPVVAGDTVEQVTENVLNEKPVSAASLAMDCPVWFDKLISQLLEKDPRKRPFGAAAVQLALAEVRRRSMSRTGVAEHASSGFSPLSVTDQKDRDEARSLLGRHFVQEPETPDATAWHDKPWFLIGSMVVIIAMLGWMAWPLSETQMRDNAETLLDQETQTSLNQAKNHYLVPMLSRFPDGEHADWAQEQIDRIDMLQADHALSVKLKRNLPLRNEGERLLAEAKEYERFGDTATAMDQYRSMETLLDDEKYRPYVNLARQRLAQIETRSMGQDEAATMIGAKLNEAERELRSGNVVAARRIWYSVIELYGNNEKVQPLVVQAQQRLAQSNSPPKPTHAP
ncbi:serine/threonine protein kinase [Novipirellula artificiosorum]|uniref:Serine/threonine-protein kinase PknL n=1 Tax=Novipirellula artificiosorum TaxID=2528016 RepID=A0A5C6DX93_9BACT|nr:serine/threonine-protein kinase [Novipirellula artificiosorum]TWU40834.1 Serine/threonine-protein kinase PknL [Novipirellula artificiosorum]